MRGPRLREALWLILFLQVGCNSPKGTREYGHSPTVLSQASITLDDAAAIGRWLTTKLQVGGAFFDTVNYGRIEYIIANSELFDSHVEWLFRELDELVPRQEIKAFLRVNCPPAWQLSGTVMWDGVEVLRNPSRERESKIWQTVRIVRQHVCSGNQLRLIEIHLLTDVGGFTDILLLLNESGGKITTVSGIILSIS